MSFTISGNVVSGSVPSSPGGTTYENVILYCVSKAGNVENITVEFLDSESSSLLTVPFTSGGGTTYGARPMEIGTLTPSGSTAFSSYFIAQAIPANTATIQVTFDNTSPGGSPVADLNVSAISPVSYGTATTTPDVPQSTLYGWYAEDIQTTNPDYLDGQCFMIFN